MRASTWNRSCLAACLALLGAFIAQGAAFLRANTQTIDEVAYLGAGYSHVARRDFRLMPEHPPLMKELAALPVYLAYRLPFDPDPRLWNEAQTADVWPIGLQLLDESSIAADDILLLARLPSLVLGTLLVALVGWWSYRLWGAGAAVVGTALAAFEPNLVAHSCLVGTDLGVTVFAFLTLYLLWEFTQRPSPLTLVGTGAAAGLAVSSKFSGIVVLGLVGLLLAVQLLPPYKAGASGTIARRLALTVGVMLVILLTAAVVVLAVYQFTGTAALVKGFRWLAQNQLQGRSAYFLGEYSTRGWWSYYLTALALKTPLGSLLLIGASLLLFRLGRPLGGREALFLLVPPTAFLLAATLSPTHIGVRYALPVYPFLFVLAARLATLQFRRAWATPLLVGIPLLGTAVSALRITPHQLAYFNELAGGPAEGPRYLSDSNIDWGQDLKNLKAYVDREGVPIIYLAYWGFAPPERYGLRYQYLPSGIPRELRPPSADLMPHDAPRELLAISVVSLQALYLEDRDTYRWLQRRKPRARLGGSIYVYDITGDADAHLRLARVYQRFGSSRRAAHELEKVLALDPEHPEAGPLLRLLLFQRHQARLGALLAASPQGPLASLTALGLTEAGRPSGAEGSGP